MKIYGIQKLTLLDFPGHTACTIFLAGCDWRCPYCHNTDLIDGTASPVMDDEELLAFLRKRQGLLDGVAITGGEPLLWRELPDLMERIRQLGYQVKLDTNGCHPDLLRDILDRHLADYVAMDIKNSPDLYGDTTGCPGINLDRITRSAAYLITGSVDYEFRTTVVAELHDDASV